MTSGRLLRAIVAAALALVVFTAGVVVGGHPERAGLTNLADPVRGWLLGDSGRDLSSQVLSVLREDYYRPIDDAALQRASVDALIAALDDPYTTYLNPEQLDALRYHNDGAYVGVGVQVAARDDAVVTPRVSPTARPTAPACGRATASWPCRARRRAGASSSR